MAVLPYQLCCSAEGAAALRCGGRRSERRSLHRNVPSPAIYPALQPWKDTSAAAIAAAGLLRLERLAGGGGNGTYAAAGLGLLQALADGYLGWDAAEGQRVEALLREGSFNVPKGLHSTGLIWGDYYFLDALAQLSWGNGTAACLPA